ncbi:aurora kinase A-interacting protein [Galendromus occidentalis]|uniref:Aurora kinase A-interacting protein n=1 Tax=Galendromus occidentalis TaxID=34638 RepID=A0AAJ6QMN1_9ACAR|nr:aurora kinase A-interacting protein [Galendromus occidentalis]
MWRRSLVNVAGIFRGLHSVPSAARTVSMPPLLPSPALSTSIIQAPRISPSIAPARIMPPSNKAEVELPYLRYKEITLPNLGIIQSPMEEPKSRKNTAIQCAVLIRIRRRKMKKHKLKKLRKRMRFVFAKLRFRREKAKEAQFKEELLCKIREAEEFDAEKYVKSVIQQIRDRHAHIETPEQRRERFLELKRKYRSNVEWIKPKLD